MKGTKYLNLISWPVFPNLFPTLLRDTRIFCDSFLSSQLHKKVTISKVNIFYLLFKICFIKNNKDYRDVQILLKKKKIFYDLKDLEYNQLNNNILFNI